MKKHNHSIKTLIIVLVCFVVFPLSITSVHAAQYEVVFKAGAHGTVNDEKSVTYTVEAGSLFPNEPTVKPKQGYVFSGWSKALPEVGSKVEGKTIYVAQYDVLIEGISYIVRYVDTQGVAIATAKTVMGEAGSTVEERAKTIPGYTYQTPKQQMELTNTTKEITFTYTLTNPEERITYVEERTDVTVPNTTNQTPNNGTNQTPNNGETNIEENQIPQGNGENKEETIDDQEVPLAKGDSKQQDIFIPVAIGTIVGLAVITMLIIRHKRKQI